MAEVRKGKAYAERRRLEWVQACGGPHYGIDERLDEATDAPGYKDARHWGGEGGGDLHAPVRNRG
jgi:hypothetical protein